MFIALTGTPGIGKTTIATLLKQQNFTVLSVKDIAFSQHFTCGKDTKRDTILIDIDAIDDYLKKTYTQKDILFIEGHTAHLLSCIHKAIILRCHPKELQKRLQNKHWKKEKIRENLDAEALDIILCEASEQFKPTNLFEIDTTSKTPGQVLESIQEIITNDFAAINTYTIGQIDWSEEYLNKNNK